MRDIVGKKKYDYLDQLFRLQSEKRSKERSRDQLYDEITDLDVNISRLEAALFSLYDIESEDAEKSKKDVTKSNGDGGIEESGNAEN